MNYTPKSYSQDESSVKPYILTDPLILESGVRITAPQVWQEKQRGKILDLFKKTEYGEMLPPDTHQETKLLHIHYRAGKHDHTPQDWDEYIAFAGKYL